MTEIRLTNPKEKMAFATAAVAVVEMLRLSKSTKNYEVRLKQVIERPETIVSSELASAYPTIIQMVSQIGKLHQEFAQDDPDYLRRLQRFWED